jgi:hypothetical protein
VSDVMKDASWDDEDMFDAHGSSALKNVGRIGVRDWLVTFRPLC